MAQMSFYQVLLLENGIREPLYVTVLRLDGICRDAQNLDNWMLLDLSDLFCQIEFWKNKRSSILKVEEAAFPMGIIQRL